MKDDDAQKPAREWVYGAEYWVPENHMFKSGSDCLEAFPDAGPACGIVSVTAFQAKCRELEAAQKELKIQKKEVERLNCECISTFLHEQRIAETKARIKELGKAINLALYYIEGDATYEGLVQQLKDRFMFESGGK